MNRWRTFTLTLVVNTVYTSDYVPTIHLNKLFQQLLVTAILLISQW